MHHNPADVLRIQESQLLPIVAAIARAVDSGSHRHTVPHPRFSRSHPNRFRIGRINCHRPNRQRRLLIENRFKSCAPIHRLPNAAASRPNINRQPQPLVNSHDVRNAPSRSRRTNRPNRQPAKRVRIQCHVLRRRRKCKRYARKNCDRSSNRESNRKTSHAMNHVPSLNRIH